MSLLEAVILGLIQGLTEFLPISSSAHLRLTPALLGWPDPGAAYSAVIQLGTTAAVIAYFRHDLLRLGKAVWEGVRQKNLVGTQEARLGWGVLLGTLPIAVLGLLLKDLIETHFRSLYVVAVSMIVLALVLYAAEKMAQHKRQVKDITIRDSLWVGAFQAVALVPGSSRSGTTLTGALFLGFRREDAARFSFLLSIPATALAGLFQLKHVLGMANAPTAPALWVGTGVAFLSGWLSIAGLLRFLRTNSTRVFVFYRVALGVCLLALLLSGMLPPL